MTKFAKKTKTDSRKTRAEIESCLIKYGAEGFGYAWRNSNAVITFILKNRRMRFILPLPDQNNKKFTHTERFGHRRSTESQSSAYEQEVRSKWRALYLVIKAKLEAVESGICTLEEEFMAHIVLPSGETVGEWMQPQIDNAYQVGSMPEFLQIGKS